MKSPRHRTIHAARAILVFFLTFAAAAQETLHCVLLDGGSDLLREEIKRRKHDLRLFNGTDRRQWTARWTMSNYRGKVPMLGQPAVRIDMHYAARTTGERPVNGFGATILVKKTGDNGTTQLAFDVDALEPGGGGDFYRMRTSGLLVPAKPNEWQEVTGWDHYRGGGSHSLWYFIETPDAVPTTGKPTSEASFGWDPQAPCRLDIVYGHLPEATLQKMGSFGPEHIRLTARVIDSWQGFSLVCQSEKPFNSTAGWGEYSKIEDEKYHESCLARIEGKIIVYESNLTLQCELQPPAKTKKDRTLIRFDGEMRMGEWKLQRVEGGPKMCGELHAFLGKSRFETRGTPSVNVAAYRISPLAEK